MGFCCAGTPQAQQHFPAPIVRLGVVGIEFECLAKGICRGLVIALLGIHQAEIEMRSGVTSVERESLVEVRGGLAPLTEAIIAQAEVVVQTGRGPGAAGG